MNNNITKVTHFKMLIENHPLISIVIICFIVLIGIKTAIESITYLLDKFIVTNKFLKKILNFVITLNIIPLPKNAFEILCLIATTQNYMQKQSNAPKDHYVVIQMIMNYFQKEKIEVKYYTDFLKKKKLIKDTNGYDQFSLTTKGRQFYIKQKKKINKIT